MFTGIIETMATVASLKKEQANLHITLRSNIAAEVKIDQSIAHNGVCLTVVSCDAECYTVTAIAETLEKTNLSELKPGDFVNIERCLKIGDRLDGHMVQGHVDTTAQLKNIENENGSYLLTFSFDKKYAKNIVEKGSICVNGISLTIVDAADDSFSVAIIPYTWENTNLRDLEPDNTVNIEFDVIGKYVQRIMSH